MRVPNYQLNSGKSKSPMQLAKEESTPVSKVSKYVNRLGKDWLNDGSKMILEVCIELSCANARRGFNTH